MSHAFLQTNAAVEWDYNKPQAFPPFLRAGREKLKDTLSEKISVLEGQQVLLDSCFTLR